MSRLFDALQNIEKRQSTGDSGPNMPFTSAAETVHVNGRQRPWLTYGGIILLIIATALAGFFIVNMLGQTVRQQTVLRKTEPAPHVAVPALGEKDIAGLPAPESVLNKTGDAPEKNHPRNHSGIKPHEPAALLSSLPDIPAGNSMPQTGHGTRKTDDYADVRLSTADSGQQTVTSKTVRTLPVLFSPEVKRMLQQAEELRIHGRIKDASEVYEILWRRTKSPLVANNLAACLMISGNTEKAAEILKKALKLNPEDCDLKYNLDVLTKWSNDVK